MKRILEFDVDGKYMQERIEEDDYEIQENEYKSELDESISFYSPILVNGEVAEGLTQAEIDTLTNQPVETTLEERVQLLQMVVDDLVMGGA